MNWKAHLSIGFLIALLFAIAMHVLLGWYTAPIAIVIGIPIALLSTLVLDLDHENGKLHNVLISIAFLVQAGGVLGILFQMMFGVWMVLGGFVVGATTHFGAQWAHHRGFMHSIPFCLIYAVIIFFAMGLSIEIGTLAFVASYSHLLLDGLPFKMK